MSLIIYSGFDLDKIDGQFELDITDTGGNTTVTINAGTFAHKDLTSISGSSTYKDFATGAGTTSGLEDALDANTTLNGDYTVVWQPETLNYAISSSVAFVIEEATNELAENILGLSGALPLSSSTAGASEVITGSHMPYFLLTGAMGAKSQVSDDFEPNGRIETIETNDGSVRSVAPSDLAVYQDFTIPFETYETTFKRQRINGKWTFQDLFENCRAEQPFLVEDDLENTVHSFRSEGAAWTEDTRERVTEDDNSQWSVIFFTYVFGRL